MIESLLITGGTGFFGRALLRYLQRDRSLVKGRITILSRDPLRFKEKYPRLYKTEEIDWQQGDVLDPDSLPKGIEFSHIMHAATESTNGPLLQPLKRYQDIADGTKNMLDLAGTMENCKFLLASSGGIYGEQPDDVLSLKENWPGSPMLNDPDTAYSQGKRAAEHLCALYREEGRVETIVARCFSFIGQDLPQRVHFAAGNFIHDALNSEKIVVRGDGKDIRTYLDQRDLAKWLMVLMDSGKSGEAFNVGSDEEVSIRELAYLIRDVLSPNKEVVIEGLHRHSQAKRKRYVPNIEKIRDCHSLRPSFSLTESIAEASKYMHD